MVVQLVVEKNSPVEGQRHSQEMVSRNSVRPHVVGRKFWDTWARLSVELELLQAFCDFDKEYPEDRPTVASGLNRKPWTTPLLGDGPRISLAKNARV